MFLSISHSLHCGVLRQPSCQGSMRHTEECLQRTLLRMGDSFCFSKECDANLISLLQSLHIEPLVAYGQVFTTADSLIDKYDMPYRRMQEESLYNLLVLSENFSKNTIELKVADLLLQLESRWLMSYIYWHISHLEQAAQSRALLLQVLDEILSLFYEIHARISSENGDPIEQMIHHSLIKLYLDISANYGWVLEETDYAKWTHFIPWLCDNQNMQRLYSISLLENRVIRMINTPLKQWLNSDNQSSVSSKSPAEEFLDSLLHLHAELVQHLYALADEYLEYPVATRGITVLENYIYFLLVAPHTLHSFHEFYQSRWIAAERARLIDKLAECEQRYGDSRSALNWIDELLHPVEIQLMYHCLQLPGSLLHEAHRWLLERRELYKNFFGYNFTRNDSSSKVRPRSVGSPISRPHVENRTHEIYKFLELEMFGGRRVISLAHLQELKGWTIDCIFAQRIPEPNRKLKTPPRYKTRRIYGACFILFDEFHISRDICVKFLKAVFETEYDEKNLKKIASKCIQSYKEDVAA